MATIPTMDTWTASEVVTAAKMNANIRDAGNFFRNRPTCQLSATATTSATTSTYAIAVMATADVDTDAMADLANNRIVIKTAGVYRVTGCAYWAANATGVRYTALRDGSGAAGAGTLYGLASVPGGTAGTAGCISKLIRFAVNDTVRLEIWQNSGATLGLGTPANLNFIAAEWVSP